MALWETTESSLGKLSQNCSNVSTHLLSPNILQQETCPLNSCVYFILVQYPLRRVNAPEEGPLPHPYRGPVAQLVEQRFALREVVSSTLAGPTLRVLK